MHRNTFSTGAAGLRPPYSAWPLWIGAAQTETVEIKISGQPKERLGCEWEFKTRETRCLYPARRETSRLPAVRTGARKSPEQWASSKRGLIAKA